MALNNPAGRLHALMLKAKSIDANSTGAEAWRQLLTWDQAETGDSGEEPEEESQPLELHVLLERIGELVALPAQIRREIERVPDIRHEFYLRHIGVFETAFRERIRFDAAWNHFVNPIQTAHLEGLEACDEVLSRRRPEPTVPDEVLEELVKEFDTLFDRVSEAELDSVVQEFLLAHIEHMRHALQTYRISGIKPVLSALEGAVGAAVLQPDLTDRVKETPEGKQFWKKMGHAFAALQAVHTTYQLAESVAAHLPMLSGGG